MSLTYSTNELSDTGLRAAGVKSINLKDEDYVVMTEDVNDRFHNNGYTTWCYEAY